ncbi:L,D-transpeptidase family protein [Rhizobium sp. RU36D]|uniref:L,D-transpeptidase family protein n=1 Tax=Rhizobium sp. RU36D TaxID=1907415 RepID=UPI0009D8AA14|nr:L,D-transpeptidase family protein [Rhizobium sp. RU36D]SMD05905.1 Putative peptidoglycan binding domain-containing protein [Rhizobium sp. RU36D]
MIKSVVMLAGLVSASVFAQPASAESGGSLQIIVSKDTQSLTIYDGGQVVAKSKVSTGKAGHTTPSGIFSILEKKKYHESNLYSNAPMPWMQRLTWSGIALHEGKVPNYPASHGCVRLPSEFARTLFQMTERGAHVIISDREITPFSINHAALFKPELPAEDGQLLSDAQLRPATIDPALAPTEVALATLPKAGASAKVVLEDIPPLRILITRRGMRETVLDAQALLNDLGFDTGIPDGQIGKQTISAINGFKRWKGLETKGELVTAEFLEKLYASAGKGEPPLGQIMVRQKFKPMFEAPVTIHDPDRALGTHFFEATKVNRFGGKAEWQALTMENHISPTTMKMLGITDQSGVDGPDAAAKALDRITIPDNIRRKINLLISEGASITISDTGLGPETGDGTDFITVTRKAPRA